MPGFPAPIALDRAWPALQLLQRIRDEAHRIALRYHRRKRGARSMETIFERLPASGLCAGAQSSGTSARWSASSTHRRRSSKAFLACHRSSAHALCAAAQGRPVLDAGEDFADEVARDVGEARIRVLVVRQRDQCDRERPAAAPSPGRVVDVQLLAEDLRGGEREGLPRRAIRDRRRDRPFPRTRSRERRSSCRLGKAGSRAGDPHGARSAGRARSPVLAGDMPRAGGSRDVDLSTEGSERGADSVVLLHERHAPSCGRSVRRSMCRKLRISSASSRARDSGSGASAARVLAVEPSVHGPRPRITIAGRSRRERDGNRDRKQRRQPREPFELTFQPCDCPVDAG